MEVPALLEAEVLPVELSEVLDELSVVEDDSSELVPAGGVPPDMVNPDEVAPGPLQATVRAATTERRTEPKGPECSAKPLPSQAKAWPLPWSVVDVI